MARPELGGMTAKEWERAFREPLFWDGCPEGPAHDRAVLEGITSADTEVRRVAAKLLKRDTQDPAAVRALVTALDDRDAIVVARALAALESRDPVELARQVSRAVAHRDAGVRVAACTAIGKARRTLDFADPPYSPGDPRMAAALTALFASLRDSDAKVRTEACYALICFGAEVTPALPVLIELYEGRAKDVRQQAANAIVAAGPPVELLARILGDPEVRGGALSHFGSEPDDPHPPLGVLPQIIDALDERDEHMLCNVLSALRGLGPAAAAATPAVTKLVGRKDVAWPAIAALAAFGPGAAGALPVLAAALRSERNRFPAAEALAAIGAAAVPFALEALRDRDPDTRSAAITALAPRLHDTPAVAAAVVGALEDPIAEVRHHTVLVLHDHRPLVPGAIAALERAAKDPDDTVRDAAQYVLSAVQ